MKFLLSVLLLLPFLGFSQVDFVWANSLDGDFSFAEEWEYPEGVYINQWGQLSCDGFCPMEIDRMKGEKGRIYDDSLSSFYAYVDTTHLYYSFEGSARVYEYGDCHYAYASEVNGMIHIQTDVNIATHSSLHIVLDTSKDSNPVTRIYILYNSIRNVPRKVYLALDGTIELSREQLMKGIIQMSFNLDFQSEEGDERGLQHWEGKILTELEQ